MEELATAKRFGPGTYFAGFVTFVGLVGGIFGIITGSIPFLSARHNVDGAWTLKTHTDTTTETKFKGMELTYTVNFTHDGTHITGKGFKLGEQIAGGSFVKYAPADQTPISVDGNVDGNALSAIFTEMGKDRHTSGQLKAAWQSKTSSWAGTFSSEAAASAGTTSLTPIP